MASKVLIILAALALSGAALSVWTDTRAARREARTEATWPPTGTFVEVGGLRIHAEITGSGPDLILLHGAGGNTREITRKLGPLLAGEFRVIAFDRPGLGYSDPVSGPDESPRRQARVLIAAARKLGVRNAVVAGQSYGGAVALAWALEAPEETAALVVISGASEPWPGRLDGFYRYLGTGFGQRVLIPLISAFLPEARLRHAIKGIFAPQTSDADYARDIGAMLSIRRAQMRHNVLQVNALRANLVEMSKYYASIDMPVEIIHGTADHVVPFDIHAEPLARQIAQAHLTRLDGIGHMPHQVAAQATANAIRRAAARAGLRSDP